MFQDEELAKYILQVNTIYRPGKTNILGSFQVWRKGSWFGMGDDLMRFCPAPKCLGTINFIFSLTESEKERVGDETIIASWPFDVQEKHRTWYEAMTSCPKCGLQSPRCTLADSYGFNMSAVRIAEKMVEIFVELDNNADVYMVRTKEDKLFHKAKEELYSVDRSMSKYARLLDDARDRDQVLYTLKNIQKDAASGGLRSSFLSIVRA